MLRSLCAWIKRYSKPQEERQQDDDQPELERVTKERDILKKSLRTLPRNAAEVRLYQAARGRLFDSTALPDAESSSQQSVRAKDDQRLLGLIKHSWLESGGVYGYRKIHDDLCEVGGDRGRHSAIVYLTSGRCYMFISSSRT